MGPRCREEDEENAMEDVEADERDEELELAGNTHPQPERSSVQR